MNSNRNANPTSRAGFCPSGITGGAGGESGPPLVSALKPRLLGLLAYILVLVLVFHRALWDWVRVALSQELNSHVILIPFVSAYLLWIRKSALPWTAVDSSPILGAATVALASVPWILAYAWQLTGIDRVSFLILAFAGFLTAGGFFFLGRQWMAAALFPVIFLFFMVPLPGFAEDALERASQAASADAADFFFSLSGVSYLRDGLQFHLAGVSMQVAQQCSGIRSSLVLFITGVFASNLLLQTPWRRWVLCLVVIPLGILRNGFRILTLGLLAAHIGPHMLHSPIHHRGGPIFFLLSLIPLLLFIWWLRRGERGTGKEKQ